MRETVTVLAKGGYRGYYGFEWKSVASRNRGAGSGVTHYAELMRRLLAEAGVTPK